jgi:hypothetical protein
MTINTGFDARLVYNADEFGLFFRQLPDQTLRLREEEKQASGFKQCKKRITGLVTCNSDGTHKPKLLLVGHAQRPRCFRQGVQLPVHYMANSSAWMTAALFASWLKLFVDEVKAYKRLIGVEVNKPVRALDGD